MTLRLTVWADDEKSEQHWAGELRTALDRVAIATVDTYSGAGGAPGQLLFIDGTTDAGLRGLEERLERLDQSGERRGRAVFLLLREGVPMPQALADGRVDDVLIHPFRPLEVASRILLYQRMLQWNEVSDLNSSFHDLIQHLREDLELAERLQKARLPVRFPEIKGLKFASRYLAGMRSGGDYFDLAEARTGSQVSLLLSDSSSYGLSSAVLSVLMRVAVKLSVDETRSCRDTVRKIHAEVLAALRETDRLSLFYGVISRKDLKLRYINLGGACAFHAPAGKGFRPLAATSGPITRSSGIAQAEEQSIDLAGGDRLALVSDGFVEAAGGSAEVQGILDRLRQAEAIDSVNELVFRAKKDLADPEQLPAQDCSAVLVDLDSRLLKVMN